MYHSNKLGIMVTSSHIKNFQLGFCFSSISGVLTLPYLESQCSCPVATHSDLMEVPPSSPCPPPVIAFFPPQPGGADLILQQVHRPQLPRVTCSSIIGINPPSSPHIPAFESSLLPPINPYSLPTCSFISCGAF